MYSCSSGQISLTSSAAGIWGLHFSFPKWRQKLPSISAPLNLADKLAQKKNLITWDIFHLLQRVKQAKCRDSSKTQTQPRPPSLQPPSSLKHFQRSPTVGSYRPQCPPLSRGEIKLRGFNTAGRIWMSGLHPGGCVTESQRDGDPHAWPRLVPWAHCCPSPSEPQVADAPEECEIFPSSEMLLALCVLLLMEEFPSRPPAGDGFRHVHRPTACYTSQAGLLQSFTLTSGRVLMSKKKICLF